MNCALRACLSQFHWQCQHELVPLIEADMHESLTAPMQRLLRIWEMVEIERFVPCSRGCIGRPARERVALARAFVAKAVLGLSQTIDLIERLQVAISGGVWVAAGARKENAWQSAPPLVHAASHTRRHVSK